MAGAAAKGLSCVGRLGGLASAHAARTSHWPLTLAIIQKKRSPSFRPGGSLQPTIRIWRRARAEVDVGRRDMLSISFVVHPACVLVFRLGLLCNPSNLPLRCGRGGDPMSIWTPKKSKPRRDCHESALPIIQGSGICSPGVCLAWCLSGQSDQLRHVADELAIRGAIAVGTCPLPPLLA